MGKKWYYYLHTNGELIAKNPAVVDSDPDYFNSPFVRKTWLIDTEDRSDAWRVVLEALDLNANHARVTELVERWGLTLEDSVEMLKRTKPTDTMKNGLKIFIVEFLKMTEDNYWLEIRKFFRSENADTAHKN